MNGNCRFLAHDSDHYSGALSFSQVVANTPLNIMYPGNLFTITDLQMYCKAEYDGRYCVIFVVHKQCLRRCIMIITKGQPSRIMSCLLINTSKHRKHIYMANMLLIFKTSINSVKTHCYLYVNRYFTLASIHPIKYHILRKNIAE